MASHLDPESLNVESFATLSAQPGIGGTLGCCTGCVSGCGINPTASGCESGGDDPFGREVPMMAV